MIFPAWSGSGQEERGNTRHMSSLQRNVLANFIGKCWSLLMGLLFVPLYIRFIGIEAYGLVGFFAVLLTSLTLFEFGLKATMNREMARYSAFPDKADEARDLAHTLEAIYWLLGILGAIIVFLSAPWIADNWVKAEKLPAGSVRQAVAMMGVCIAFQWPVSLYNGGLMGLERQVLLNCMVAALDTARGVGAVLAIWLLAPTITVFFGWQIIISILQAGVLAFTFWRAVPVGTRAAKIDVQSLRRVWRFTAGMGGTGLVTFLISQLDKVILSKLLTLSMFGYYNLANQLNNATKMAAGSFLTAFLPRMSSLCAKEDQKELRILYHKGCQFVSCAVLPASAVIALFSHEIIHLWSQNENVASMAAPIASLLVVGSAISSMMGVPYIMTVSSGWAMFGFYQNLIAAIVMVPIMFILAKAYGGTGAAIAWLILNTGYILFSMPIITRRILPGELRNWYFVDVGRPMLLSFGLVGLGRYFVPGTGTLLMSLLMMFLLWAVTQAICALSLPYVRQYFLQILRNGRSSGSLFRS
jgi:O-antigen/teichoic acid export membrane protein